MGKTMEKFFEKNKGITIVALVVTIIVLIILAGISIVTLFGDDGVVTVSKNQKREQEVNIITQTLKTSKIDLALKSDSGEVLVDNYIEEIKNSEKVQNKVTKVEKIDEDIAYITLDNDYVYLLEEKQNGDLEITYQGEVTNVAPRIRNVDVKSSNQKIEVKVTALRTETYKFYIKEKGASRYTEMGENTTGEFVFRGLTKDRKYYIKIEAINSKGQDQEELSVITADMPNLTTAEVTFKKSNTNWTNENVVTEVEINTRKDLIGCELQYAKFNAGSQPTEEELELGKWTKYTDEKITSEINEIIYIRLAKGYNATSYISTEITNIDKVQSIINTQLSSSDVTTKEFTLNIESIDELSGLGKIVWNYKLKGAESYSNIEDIYTELNGKVAGIRTQINKSKQITDLKTGTYSVYALVYDVAGNYTTSETIEVTLKPIEKAEGATANPTEWINGDVTVTLPVKGEFITQYQIGTLDKEGEWKEYNTEFKVTSNTTVYYRYSDGINAGEHNYIEITNIDKDAPEVTNVEIKNVTPTGYDVYVNGVKDNGSGVNRVVISTWTEANGQDDIKTVNAEDKGNGTWYYRVNVTDHSSQIGKYNTKVEIYDGIENKTTLDTKTVDVPGVVITFDKNDGTTDKTTITKGYNLEIGTLPTVERVGYTFAGWYTDKTNGTQITQTTKVPAANTTYYARWTANTNTPYKVVHEQMELDGTTYKVVETENLTGTTDTKVTPAVKAYEGFTSPSTQEVTIAADGSTIVTYKYERNKYLFDLNGYLDSKGGGNISGYGTVDVYINGALAEKNTVDCYRELYYGSTYEVKNINASTGHTYNGVYSGTLTGTITGATTVHLNFTTNKYTITYDANLPKNYMTPNSSTVSFSNFTGAANTCFSIGAFKLDGLKTGDKVTLSMDIAYNNITVDSTKSYYIQAQGAGNVTDWNPGIGFGNTTKVVGTGTLHYECTTTLTESLSKNSYFSLTVRTDYITGGTLTISNMKITKESTSSVQLAYGSKLETLPSVSEAGYIFNGWYTAVSGGTQVTTDTTVPAANTTYYAQWTENTYTISYNLNGGSGALESQTKTYGTDLTLSSIEPTRTNYVFLGWATSNTATQATYAAGGKYTANESATLYAVWQRDYIELTKVSNPIGDISSGVMTISGNSLDFNVPGAGYEFIVTAYYNITITTKNSNGDTIETCTAKQGTTTSSSSITTTSETTQVTVNGIGTVEVKLANDEMCRIEDARPIYTLTFKLNDGTDSVFTTMTGRQGQFVQPASQPTRIGYVFRGWSTIPTGVTSTGGMSISTGGQATGNITLYAVWQRDYIELTKVSNPIGDISSGVMTISGNSLDFNVPGQGYKFEISNFYQMTITDKDANGNILKTYKVDQETTSSSPSTTSYVGTTQVSISGVGTVKVKLSDKTDCRIVDARPIYTITFMLNDGTDSVYATMTGRQGQSVIPENPTRQGYKFDGWATTATATSGSNPLVNGNTTLYAVWRPNSYTLTVNPNGGTYNSTTSNTTISGKNDTGKNVGTPSAAPTGYTVTFNGNSGTTPSAITSTKSFSGWTKSGTGEYVAGSNASVGGMTRTVKTENGETYENFIYTASSPTNSTWYSLGYPAYTYTSGDTYEIRFKVRVNSISNSSIEFRHAAMGNDWGTSTRVTKWFSAATSGWQEVVLTRTLSGTTITQSGTNYNIAPKFEVYTSDLKGQAASANFDIKDVMIINRTTGKLLQSNANMFWFREGNGTLTANYSNNAITLPSSTRTGYTFKGWYTAASGGTRVGGTNDKYTPTAAITLYAQWQDNTNPTVTLTANTTGWTNGNVKVTASYSDNVGVTNKTLTCTGTSGTDYTVNGTTDVTVITNGKTVTATAKDAAGNTTTKTLAVNNIDKTKPTISTALSSSNVTTSGFTLNIGVTDTTSGLSRIVWYYKLSTAGSYTSVTDTYTTMNGTTAGTKTAVTKSKTISGLASGTYNAYAIVYDVAGNAQQSGTITIYSLPSSLTVYDGNTNNTTFVTVPSSKFSASVWYQTIKTTEKYAININYGPYKKATINFSIVPNNTDVWYEADRSAEFKVNGTAVYASGSQSLCDVRSYTYSGSHSTINLELSANNREGTHTWVGVDVYITSITLSM